MKFKTLFLTAALTILTAFSSFAWDKEIPENHGLLTTNYHDSFKYVKVQAEGTALGWYPKWSGKRDEELKWGLREVKWSQVGSGYVVREGSIITAAHVIEPDIVSTPVNSSSSFNTRRFKTLSRDIWIYNYTSTPLRAWVYYVDYTQDIAILHYVPNKIFLPGNVEVSDQMLLTIYDERYGAETGDAIAVVVHERDNEGYLVSRYKILKGTIGSVDAGLIPDPKSLPWLSLWDFCSADIPIIPGDSGSPVFAFYYGKPILIGIARAVYFDGMVRLSIIAHIGKTARALNIEE